MNAEIYTDLLIRLKEGDEKAFAIIYENYWDKLYYVAFQKLRIESVAEEIVQEVFLILWKKREELTITSLSAYLAAMVRYSVYRYLASEKARQVRETNYISNQVEEGSLMDKIADRYILDKVFELSNQLPEKCRLVFQYNKIDDLSLKEVAEQLNISQKTAEAHLTKALKVIRLSMRGLINLFYKLFLFRLRVNLRRLSLVGKGIDTDD